MSTVASKHLWGCTALVTGGASGIGLATVEEFARRGASVALAYHRSHEYDGEAEAARLRDEGFDVRAYDVDVTDAGSAASLQEAVARDLDAPDIVVANAAIATMTPIDGGVGDDWARVLETNLSGAYRTLAEAIPAMRERGYGRLLVTTSTSGPLVAWPGHAGYCASKAGLVGLVRVLAVELAPRGITVNAVAPGLVRTPQSLDPVNGLGPERLSEVAAELPVGRAGDASEVAAAFAYLASERAGFITGQTMVLDGGASLLETV